MTWNTRMTRARMGGLLMTGALIIVAGCELVGSPASAHPHPTSTGLTSGSDTGTAGGGGEGSGSATAGAPLTSDEVACGIVQELRCGDVLSFDTSTHPAARSDLADYGDIVGRYTGPELGFRFVWGGGPVDLRLVDATPTEMNQDLILLRRDAGACDPAGVEALGFNSIERDLPAGTWTLMVDGYDGDAGAFTLEASCDGEAGSGGGGEGCSGVGTCVESFPFVASGTTVGGADVFDSYDCSSADMSGPERIYEVVLDEPGYLSGIVTSAPGVDVDMQLLRSLDPDDCMDRGDEEAWGWTEPGTYYAVVDSFDGDANAGAYEVTIGATPAPAGSCATVPRLVERLGGGPAIDTPTSGRIVMEAHLVTTLDGYGTAGAGAWPQTQTENLATHFANTRSVSGFVMQPTEPWAPHNGNNYGQGAYWSKLPPLEETWYMNMMWAQRPAPGTRVILRANGRAVVAAAGFETGPGEHDVIGGATEEIHRYLGTVHRDVIEVGFAADQALPFGPITCD